MDHGRSAEHAALSDVRKDEGRDWERVELVVAGCGGIPLLLDTTEISRGPTSYEKKTIDHSPRLWIVL